MKTLLKRVISFTALAATLNASAAFISADNAVLTSGATYSSYFNVQWTTDCSGLTVCDETGLLTAGAAGNATGNQWATRTSSLPASISYTFDGGGKNLDAFYLWNSYYSYLDLSSRSIKDFSLDFYSGASNLGSQSFVASGTQSLGAEKFDGFFYSNVTSVTFNIDSNYGDRFTWFQEVGFNESDGRITVSEPSSFALLGLGLFGLGLARRKV